MLVSEIMVSPVRTVSKDALLKEAAALMIKHSISCLPVVDEDGKLVGIISESDFVGVMRQIPFSRETGHTMFGQWTGKEGIGGCCREVASLRLSDFMQTHVITVEESETVEDAVAKMLKNRVRRLPVVRDGKPIAVFARKDLLGMFA